MTDWAKGYSSKWELRRLMTSTWATSGESYPMTSLSIKRSCTESVPLIENSTMSCSEALDDGWYTAFLVADSAERIAVGTFLFERSSESSKWPEAKTYSYTGYSVLKPADDVVVTVGSYVPKGSNGAEEAAKILRGCVFAPITVIGGFSLTDNVVLSIGMSKLAAAWSILDSGGFCIMIDGYGRITICKRPIEPSLTLTKDSCDILSPELDLGDSAKAMRGVPNRYYAVSGSMVATAVNQDPESPTSYQSRGRWIDACDKSPKRVNGETLQEYAERMLAEASTITTSLKIGREYAPNVGPFSVIRIELPSEGLSGDYVVESQSITCGNGISVDETAGKRVSLWR